MNITTFKNGFTLDNIEYVFNGTEEIISETQCHVETDKGIILLDLSLSINDKFYKKIDSFLLNLKT